ncbi:MAG TPA: GNAT family N-acetyltransferase [Caulobacteraceae bacterium]|jgi:RimJ/RimL family protein N-acetyltransferase
MTEPLLPPTPVLHGARLTLRPVRLDDGPAMQKRFAQWEVVRYLNARTPWPYPADGGQAHARRCVDEGGARKNFTWAITLKSGEDELIGLISVRPDDGVSREQRGFWIDPEFWGQGLMTEAAELVTEYVFVELGWPRLWLDNAEANTGSHRIKEKQGARIVERIPDAPWVSGPGVKVVWLLTREDWLARRSRGAIRRMPPTPVLHTARLTLRPCRLEDTSVIQRRFPQWEIIRYLSDGVPWPYPDDGAATNMVETLEEMAAGKKMIWAITLKGADDELIGRIDLWPDDGVSRTQRGFWLDPEFWGKGLMTEAAERVTEYAFTALGWRHLWLRNGEVNRASYRVKEKQGARVVDRVPAKFVSGEMMSVVWYLEADDWLAHREGRS